METGYQKKTTSIRLSDYEKSIIKQRANEKGMDTTSYITFMALHGSDGLSPEILVRIQNIVNEAVEAAKQMNMDKAMKLEREVNKLWQLLK